MFHMSCAQPLPFAQSMVLQINSLFREGCSDMMPITCHMKGRRAVSWTVCLWSPRPQKHFPPEVTSIV